LQLEHTPFESPPGERIPFIHQRWFGCGHDVWAANGASTVQMIVLPSAYLAAFPRALASEAILLLRRMRLTPARTILIRER
jgi:hypothetical protein